ncbi:RNA polymerase sigma-70 factor [Mucilaginibacter litoreus]|uniref:RNA polymerase sigma-70 factor n=1 Tax=Mucilaginibacter litoreus TaxID=1048221 RepID=A0ABW3AMN7_9SPHI
MRLDTGVVNKKDFTRLYAQHFETFTLLALQYVKDVIVAEDIVQDVFLKFWEAPFILEDQSAIKSYFGRIVINNSLNYIKREKNLQRHHDSISKTVSEQDVYSKLHENELKVLIYKQIELLPEQCKKVFKMNRFDGLKYREIAEQLNISERTVENHIANALKVLRKKILTPESGLGIDINKYKTILLILGIA